MKDQFYNGELMVDQALLDQMLTDAGVPLGDDIAKIGRRSGNRVFPLSFQQELLWLFDRAYPGLHVYNIMRTARLRGPFDAVAFGLALNAVVARHEILRTTYHSVNGVPRQIVNAPQDVTVAWFEVRERSAADDTAEAARIVGELVRRPFDLARDLQLRASVLKLAEEDHIVLLESHHIASDEWSRNILFDEIEQLYDGHRTVLPEFRPLAIQYGDFSAWQREHVAGARLERTLAYWRDALANIPASINLPTDRPYPMVPRYEGEIRQIVVEGSLFAALQRIGNARHATSFMVLLAALGTLLGRYANSDDIVIGTPITSRSREEIDGLIGYFVNVLPLRVSLHQAPSFEALLDRVRDSMLDAYDHLEAPYERLMELAPPTAPGCARLIQVTLALVDAEPRTLDLASMTVMPFDTVCPFSKLDLEFFVRERAGRLIVTAQYRSELFDADTVDRLLSNFGTLLEAVARDPATCVFDLPMRAPGELALIERYNSTAASYTPETLHRLIAAQVSRNPEAIALEWTDSDRSRASISYRELGERTAALAARLRELGVGPGVGVGVCMPRSADLIIGLLGVLHAGGYYVPLDPEYPHERLRYMLADAGVRIVLTVEALETTVRPLLSDTMAMVALDDDGTDPATADTGSNGATCDAAPDDTAYVIYTSGSTGKPKGVVVSHRAVTNYLCWMQRAYAPQCGEGVLQRAPASFDASVWELFLPLVSGARLVLAPSAAHNDPLALLEAMELHDVRLAQFVPSHLQMILDSVPREATRVMSRLRRLFLGGERLSPELLDRFLASCPVVPVTNLYGPTEATVYATHWDTSAATRESGAIVPLGQPIDNVQVYICDARCRPLPVGVTGELCIGGAGLAKGYLNAPQLTSERFIWNNESGSVLYRTGDLARQRADGTLEYLGRSDTQVKLRGFRVELGEIEAELSRHSEVDSAVVIVRTIGLNQVLIAFCKPSGTPGGDLEMLAATLRARLRTTLPIYMIPTALEWVDVWPLNANGKLDRSSLAKPYAPNPATLEPFALPSTPIEECLVRMWTEILHCDGIGVRDNFFDLGGHSILAMRIVSRVAEAFGARLPLAALFDRPTIAELALLIQQCESSATETPTAPVLRRVPRAVVKRPVATQSSVGKV